MALKLFTNKYKENPSEALALDSTKVISVYEAYYNHPENNSISTVTNIYCMTGVTYQVEETLELVIARLNEE